MPDRPPPLGAEGLANSLTAQHIGAAAHSSVQGCSCMPRLEGRMNASNQHQHQPLPMPPAQSCCRCSSCRPLQQPTPTPLHKQGCGHLLCVAGVAAGRSLLHDDGKRSLPCAAAATRVGTAHSACGSASLKPCQWQNSSERSDCCRWRCPAPAAAMTWPPAGMRGLQQQYLPAAFVAHNKSMITTGDRTYINYRCRQSLRWGKIALLQ